MKTVKEEEREQILTLREQRVEIMLSGVRTRSSADKVPIAYAVDRLMSEIQSVQQFSHSRR